MAHPLEFAALGEDGLERAAVLAARAFADSPPYLHAFGRGSTGASRERVLTFLFRKTFALRAPHGCCHPSKVLQKAAPATASRSRTKRVLPASTV